MIPTGLLFDGQGYAVMAISHAPNSSTPDVMSDKDGDRVLLLTDGDLALQIGQTRYQMTPGDAVQIPRGTPFGNAHSTGGAKLLLIRGKPPRSFSLVR
jgi:quercetin dioxygenase-like cupin family protein